MLDRYNRHIHYLRVSLTDRCNLRCTYCMPEEGVSLRHPHEILSYEEILEVVKTAAGLGMDKIRFTGGEPLVRKGVEGLISQVARIPGIRDIGLTTNGSLLKEKSADLWSAGLRRLNISLDTLDPEKYRRITRRGDLEQVLEGIFEARNIGFEPVKINYVRIPGVNVEDEPSIREFCRQHGFQMRVIRMMNLQRGEFYPVEGGYGGRCDLCNRLRLTALGDLVPCLFSDSGYNVRELGIRRAFDMALMNKPERGGTSNSHSFYNIGG